MSKAAEYWSYARECQRVALEADNEDDRQSFLDERRRWLANEHLQRVDGPDKATTIFDRNKGEFTLLNPVNRTFRKLEGAPRMPMAPQNGTALKRGGESVVTGLSCVDWSQTAHRVLDAGWRAAPPRH